jgi:probable phosphoglycerate mutase
VDRSACGGVAEASADQSSLSEAGRRQAALLGARLAGGSISRISHSPLGRAVETAQIVAQSLPGVPVVEVPELTDIEDPSADQPGSDALVARFARPAADELVITHNFRVAWFVRDALDAPVARWRGLNQCNAGLTVIGYRPGRPPSVLVFNDVIDLPPELQWTGFAPAQTVRPSGPLLRSGGQAQPQQDVQRGLHIGEIG